MRLFEYEAKSILRDYGIPVPKGMVFQPGKNLALESLALPCYVKAQVPVGGRGKAGGVLLAQTRDEAQQHADRISRLIINGFPVSSILVEESQQAERELYLSIAVDRSLKCYVIVAGAQGGVDVEETLKTAPSSILKLPISPLRSLREFDVSSVSRHFGLDPSLIRPIILALWGIAAEMDAELVEINPLVVQGGKLLALDAKIQIDDNATFRQTGLASLPSRGRSAEEQEAFAQGLNYVSLEGNVGIVGNGAGLTMATMDLVESSGGKPANFLDLGGGALSDSFRRGVLFLMGKSRVNAILVNIFGGITRCDEVAKGIAAAVAEARTRKPIVVRLLGTNETEGRAILESSGIAVFSNPAEASRKAVALAGGLA